MDLKNLETLETESWVSIRVHAYIMLYLEEVAAPPRLYPLYEEESFQ